MLGVGVYCVVVIYVYIDKGYYGCYGINVYEYEYN